MASMAAPARATRPSARSSHSGIPTWLAQPAALVPGSRLLDAPADGLTVAQTLEIARGYELVIMHTSTPSFPTDCEFAEHAEATTNPRHHASAWSAPRPMVDPDGSLKASDAVDFVCREEFDYTCKDVAAGLPLADIKGLSYRDDDGPHRAQPAAPDHREHGRVAVRRAGLSARSEDSANYFIGYLKHPYVSFYTGRGCRSKCTFCLWPQTVGGHRYRVRSAENVLAEVQVDQGQHAGSEGDHVRR